MAFWTGGLSQRVRTLEREARDLRAGTIDVRTAHDSIIEIKVTMKSMSDDIAKLERHSESTQRQLANLMRTGGIHEFSEENSANGR